MTPREQVEYTQLRATIRERGTARSWIFAAGVIGWAGVLAVTGALAATPLATVLPLVTLAAIFEAVFSLHVGVERVGRYLQVFYETDGQAGWEHAAMAFGQPRGAATADALFVIPFLLAAAVNLAPSLVPDPTRAELIFVIGAHLLFVLRLLTARAAASRQRAIDLARFTELREAPRTAKPDRLPA